MQNLLRKLRKYVKSSDLYTIRRTICNFRPWLSPERHDVLLQEKLPVLEKEMLRQKRQKEPLLREEERDVQLRKDPPEGEPLRAEDLQEGEDKLLLLFLFKFSIYMKILLQKSF